MGELAQDSKQAVANDLAGSIDGGMLARVVGTLAVAIVIALRDIEGNIRVLVPAGAAVHYTISKSVSCSIPRTRRGTRQRVGFHLLQASQAVNPLSKTGAAGAVAKSSS